MKRNRILVLSGVLLFSSAVIREWGGGMVFAQAPAVFPPPRVRVVSQELFRQYDAFAKVQVDGIETNKPIRYAFLDATYEQTEDALIIGDAWRKWGYWILGPILDSVHIAYQNENQRILLPAYEITRGPRRWDDLLLQKVKVGRVTCLALTRHADGYWLVAKVLNRHDFAEVSAIAERVALTGRDDTIGVKRSSFRLQMNPMQQAYLNAEKQVRAGEMTEEEFHRQFTPEMRRAVFDPNNADLVLGKE